MNIIVRGILIGGSLGVFAGLLGVTSMSRGLLLGGLVGILAVLTMNNKREKTQNKNVNTDDES